MQDSYSFRDGLKVGLNGYFLLKKSDSGIHHICSTSGARYENTTVEDPMLKDISKKYNIDIEVLVKAWKERI